MSSGSNDLSMGGRVVVVLIALFTAAITGCGATAAAAAVLGLIGGFGGILIGAMIGLATLPFWLGCVFVAGGPVWVVLHASGRRDRGSALVSGAVTAGLGALLAVLVLDQGQVSGLMWMAIPAAFGGVAAGYTVWRLAYPEAQG